MTALPARRRRRTVIGGVGALVLLLAAGGLTVLGASTVVNSKAGEEVQGDTRLSVELPNTDNAALAVVNEDLELTSLIIATLTPSGVGGSVVTIPVNADASIGFGDQRRPLNAELDVDEPESFFQALEGTLALSLQFGEIVGPDRLAQFIAPATPAIVELPVDIANADESASTDDGETTPDPESESEELQVDDPDDNSPGNEAGSSDAGAGDDDSDVEVVLAAGQHELTAESAAEALLALDRRGASYDHHLNDVEIWSAIAATAPVDGDDPATDEFDRPIPSDSIDELFARLWQGPVQVRDLLLQSSAPSPDLDVVLIDRRDSLLVFAQISPARVSTPNPGLIFRIEIPISAPQIAADGRFLSRSDLARTLVGELLFLSANVQSIDMTAEPAGASTVTRIEVEDERYIADMETLRPLIFGESEIVVAPDRVQGINVVLRLGTGYLDLKNALGSAAPGVADLTTSTVGAAPTSDVVADAGDTVDTDG